MQAPPHYVLEVRMHAISRQRFGREPELVAADEFRATGPRFNGEDVLNRFDIKVDAEVRQVIHLERDMSVRFPVQAHPFELELPAAERLHWAR